ncbi:MAG: prolyl oligopeptidase family serine peptidase [Pseudomonadota bacterium]
MSPLRSLLAAAMGLGGALLAPAAMACGPESDCVLGERTYRLSLPADHDSSAPIGALFYAHGYKGSAEGAMRNMALREVAHARGLALVALKSAGDDWSLAHAPNVGPEPPDNEPAYVDAVIEDVADRITLDRERLIATGFSAGGMMTWTLACERPASFLAFVPIAGTFWAPVPQRCAGEAPDLIHIHGTTDRIVPLEGRRIADTRQGAITAAIALMRRHGRFEPAGLMAVEAFGPEGGCRIDRNALQRELLFCTHPGGHSFESRHLGFALDRLLGLTPPPKG